MTHLYNPPAGGTAIVRRNVTEHRRLRDGSRRTVFDDYRLRVVSVTRDYGMTARRLLEAAGKGTRTMKYRFGDIELDDASYVLSRAGTHCHVEPRVFDLIRFLARRPDEVISRDELLEHVWRGRIVSDTTIAGTVKAARKALGDDGDAQRYIRTVRGRGFQLVAAIERVESQTSSPSATAPMEDKPLPAIAVLPFQAFGDEDVLGPLADGVVENLTTVLTRVPLLQVASRTASFAYKGRSATVEDVRRELGVDFLLEGSVQRAAGGVRLNVQLIDTTTGFHAWARQIDAELDAGALDALLERTMAPLEPQLVRRISHAVGDDGSAPSGKQLLLRAMGLLSLSGWHRDTFEESAELLREAIAREPTLALAHAFHALVLGLGHRVGLLERSAATVERALEEADAALALDDMDSTVVSLAGCAIADAGQPERAVPLLERAIELNPANGHAWAALGSAQALLGDFEAAARNLERGVAISPADARRAVWCAVLAIARLLSGATEEAVRSAEEGCRHDERNYIPKVVLAGARLTRGELSPAERALREAVRVKPDLTRDEIAGLLGERLADALSGLRGTGDRTAGTSRRV